MALHTILDNNTTPATSAKNNSTRTTMIIPAILSYTQKDYAKKLRAVKGLIRTIHLDVIDGKFVPNKTIQLDVIKKVKNPLRKEAHFMVEKPENYIAHAAQAGIHTFIFHIESHTNQQQTKHTIYSIKKAGMIPAIAINPRTPIKKLFPFFPHIKSVLLMSVQPGKGGQKFMPSVIKKIQQLRKKAPNITITVDGGLNEKTLPLAKKAGANHFVMGSAIFKTKNIKKTIETYKKMLSH